MEVVIGVILLIGAFALGHTTADQEAEETRARLEREKLLNPWKTVLSFRVAATVSTGQSSGT